MKIYGWIPESYGEWAYVLAESPEEAMAALLASKADVPEGRWDKKYHDEAIDEWLKRTPDISYEAGKVIFGEVP